MKQLKRLTSVLLVLGIVLGLMPLSAFAAEPEFTEGETFTVEELDNGYKDTYTFTLDGGTAKLTHFDTTAPVAGADAVIPSPAKGYSVTSIGDGAFYGCTRLKTVILPDSIKSIGTAAFCNCTNLTTVDLGNSVETIDESAFALCTHMEKLTIPKSIKEIKDGAFNDGTYHEHIEKNPLKKLYYTGTQAQWNKLAQKCDFENKNPKLTLTNLEEFHCAHTVSFDYCDPAKEPSKVVQKEVRYEGTVTPPADPTAQHYRFEGWHTEKTTILRLILTRKLRKI